MGEPQEPQVDDTTAPSGAALAGGATRKRRKRGGSSHSKEAATMPVTYRHIIYDEEASASVTDHEEQAEEPTDAG